MKPLKLGVGRVCVITMLAIAISLYLGSFVYASSMDNERRSFGSSSSSMFGSSYVNRTMYETQSIINQATVKEDSQDEPDTAVNELQNKVGDDVKKGADTKVTTELKRKSGASSSANNNNNKVAAANTVTTTVGSSQSDVAIGTGTNKEYSNGRLMAETFKVLVNGEYVDKRYVFAGFENVGTATIQEAIVLANAGDSVIVKSGSYNVFSFKNGVNLYGGYDENGILNRAAPSIINGSAILIYHMRDPIEINGFIFNAGIDIGDSYSVTLRNNTFNGGLDVEGERLWGCYSNVTLEGNSFINSIVTLANPETCVLATNNSFSYNSGANSVGIEIMPGVRLVSSNNDFNVRNALSNYGGIASSDHDYFKYGVSQSTYNNGTGELSVANAATNPNTGLNNNTQSNNIPAFTFSAATTQNAPLALTSGPLTIDTATRPVDYDSSTNGLGATPTVTIFKELLANQDNLAGGMTKPMVGKILTGALSESALSTPLALTADQNTSEMDIAMKLSNIMKNPTEEQKLVLDTIQSLVSDMSDVTDKELQAVADKIIEIAANYLLNQALPDLIKAGDVAGIKGIFQDLNNSKTRIMLEYQTNTAPYYAELKKMLQDNAKGLTSILGKTLTQEELDKLPSQKINEILDTIRRDPNKTSYENDILDYKKKYIEPSKKIMEEKMKEMLEKFAKQLSAALEVKDK